MSSPAVSKTANSTIDKNLKGYLPTLDGWRAIAIMAVLLDHATTREWLQKIQYFRTGPNGVSLFFAISGYLICSRLLEEESAARANAATQKRLRQAGFPYAATIEQFDFHFRPELKRQVVRIPSIYVPDLPLDREVRVGKLAVRAREPLRRTWT